MAIARHPLVRCAAIACALLAAAPALSIPSSLRSADDVVDLTDAFMTSLMTNDVRGAYRLAARYWPRARQALRQRLGLSLGYELVASEPAGERVLRVSQLERFDKGGSVWRFTFYRADMAWQLVDVRETDHLGVLYGEPERRADREATNPGEDADATVAADDVPSDP